MRYIRTFIVVLTATAALAGCTSDSYPGLEYDPVMSPSLVNNESGRSTGWGLPVTVSVSKNSFSFASVITRGSGPFEATDVSNDLDRLDNTIFYLYAFRDNADLQGPLTANPSFEQRSKNDNEDCLLDGNDYTFGVPAKLHAADRLLKTKRANLSDTTYYYGSRNQDTGYNFFAYCMDGFDAAQETAHRDATGVYYDLTLDGTRDVMVGHSLKLDRQTLESYYPNIVESMTQTQRDHVLNIGNYSAYSAYFGIHPILHIEHLLTRLAFWAYPADESANFVEFTNIEIEARYAGRLYVVKPDVSQLGFTFNDARRSMKLKERQPGDDEKVLPLQDLTPTNYRVQWTAGMDSDKWLNNKAGATHIGCDMLLPPDATYRMKLEYRQYEPGTGLYRKVSAEYALKAPELENSRDPKTGEFTYLPNNTYTINIGVYGGRRPEVGVGSLEPWNDGGEIIIPSDPSEE